MATRPVGPTATGLLAQLLGNATLDAEAVLDAASVLHFPGRSGLAGQYQGRQAVVALLQRLAELTAGTIEFAPQRVAAASGEAVVLISRLRACRLGKRLDVETVHVVAKRGGTVRELWLFHPDQSRVDEFWNE